MSTDKSTVAGPRTCAMAVYTSFICEHVYARCSSSEANFLVEQRNVTGAPKQLLATAGAYPTLDLSLNIK